MKRSASAMVLILLAVGCARGQHPALRAGAERGSSTSPSSGASPRSGGAAGQAGQGGQGSGSPSPSKAPSSLPTKGASLAPSAVRPAQAAERLFDETGATTLSGCYDRTQAPPTPSRLTIDPADGDRQRLVRDRGTQEHPNVTTAIVQYRVDGIYLVYLSQTSGFALVSTTEFMPSPPVLLVPAHPSVGQSWAFVLTSTDGKVTVDSNNSVDSIGESVTIGNGQNRSTDKITTNSHITGQTQDGPVDMTTVASAWYDRSLSFQVKEQSHTDGTVSVGCKVTSDIQALIQKV
ncbi:MAG: hypothetical protein LC723_05570 [Actinobacteria bacterium]|nr:hypothetical protein [Actinomycetota bacterium]